MVFFSSLLLRPNYAPDRQQTCAIFRTRTIVHSHHYYYCYSCIHTYALIYSTKRIVRSRVALYPFYSSRHKLLFFSFSISLTLPGALQSHYFVKSLLALFTPSCVQPTLCATHDTTHTHTRTHRFLVSPVSLKLGRAYRGAYHRPGSFITCKSAIFFDTY